MLSAKELVHTQHPPMAPAWVVRNRLVAAALLALVAVGAATGCEKARQERAERELKTQIATAIERYSSASDSANVTHKEVIDAFAAANASTSVPEYKAALRTKVLPAMDDFVNKLAAIPTETAELKTIHGQLTEAYRRARDEIAEFEQALATAAELGKFDAIRATLQRAVAGYRTKLTQYYRLHDRQLRVDAVRPAEAPTPSAPVADPVAAPVAARVAAAMSASATQSAP